MVIQHLDFVGGQYLNVNVKKFGKAFTIFSFCLFFISFMSASSTPTLSPKIELILSCKRHSMATGRASKNPWKATVNMLSPMHDQSWLVFIALFPNRFNFEDARMQQRDTSVSQMWSNSNCWGDIALRADRWLDRQRLWETIKQRGTEAWTLRECTSEIRVHWAHNVKTMTLTGGAVWGKHNVL